MTNFRLAIQTRGSLLRRAVGVCFVGLTLAVSGLHNPSKASEANITTLSLAPVPDRGTIVIRLPIEEGESDDFGLALVLAAEFAILLSDLGYTPVERGGELLFRFSAEEPAFAQVSPLTRHVSFQRQNHGMLETRGHPVAVMAVLGETNVSQGDQDTFRLRVSVARPRKPPLWAGFIERPTAGAEQRPTYIDMANEVMRFWGRTHP